MIKNILRFSVGSIDESYSLRCILNCNFKTYYRGSKRVGIRLYSWLNTIPVKAGLHFSQETQYEKFSSSSEELKYLPDGQLNS